MTVSKYNDDGDGKYLHGDNCIRERHYAGPLYYAAKANHIDVMKELIEAGAHISPSGATRNRRHRHNGSRKQCFATFEPLYVAAAKGHASAVDLLLSYNNRRDDKFKVYLNCVSLQGKSPLHIASEKGFTNIIEMLLKAGAAITDS